MLDTNARERAEALFDRNRKRDTEIEDALKQDAARHEAAVANMKRLRALRLSRSAQRKSNKPSDGAAYGRATERAAFILSVLAGETVLGWTGFTRWCAAKFTVPPLRPLLDYFGPDTTPAAYARVAIDPYVWSGRA
jgi:hypothetical protein